MTCVICGGKKGINIKKAIEKAVSVYGDDILVINTSEELCDYIGSGFSVKRVLVTEQSFTDELTETDLGVIRDRIIRIVNSVESANSTEIIFLTRYEEIAKILSEETVSIRSRSIILFREPPYSASFMISIFKEEMEDMLLEYRYSEDTEETGEEWEETGATEETGDTEEEWEEAEDWEKDEWENSEEDNSEDESSTIVGSSIEGNSEWEEEADDSKEADEWEDIAEEWDDSSLDGLAEKIEEGVQEKADNDEEKTLGEEESTSAEDSDSEEKGDNDFEEDSNDDWEETATENKENNNEDASLEDKIISNVEDWEEDDLDTKEDREEKDESSYEEYSNEEYNTGDEYKYEDEYSTEEESIGTDYNYEDDIDSEDVNNIDNIQENKETANKKRNGRGSLISKGDIKSEQLRVEIEPFAKRGNSIVVTGPSGAGTSTVVLNMANTLAGMGFDVLIVDMDTINRAQGYMTADAYRSMGVDDSNMMAAVNSSSNISRHITIERAGLHLLSMGMGGEVAPVDEILAKDKISRFINLVKGSYNFVIYDMQMKDAMEFLSEITYSADNLVLVTDESNWGISKLLMHACNIQSEDMQDNVFTRAQILFNKARGINRIFGHKIKRVSDITTVMDNKVLELVGESTGLLFSDMHIIGEIPYDIKYENGWFKEKQYTDTREGKEIYYRVIRNTILRK